MKILFPDLVPKFLHACFLDFCIISCSYLLYVWCCYIFIRLGSVFLIHFTERGKVAVDDITKLKFILWVWFEIFFYKNVIVSVKEYCIVLVCPFGSLSLRFTLQARFFLLFVSVGQRSFQNHFIAEIHQSECIGKIEDQLSLWHQS